LLSYSFTKIVGTPDGLGNFGEAPALANDNAGTVAFRADTLTTAVPRTSIYTGNGGPLRQLYQAQDDETLDPFPSINNFGSVAFLVNRPGSQAFGYAVGDVVAFLYPTDRGPFYSLEPPSLNNDGKVAFHAMRPILSNPDGVFLGDGGPFTVIDSSGPFNITFGKFPFLSNSTTAVAPQVAYLKHSFSTTDDINIGSGGPPRTLYSTSGPFFASLSDPALNDFGRVAFYATFNVGPTTRPGIFAGDGGSFQIIALGGDIFNDFDPHPAINNGGTVAFQANLTESISGIFTGTAPDNLTKVITTGDDLFGSTVTKLHFFRQGLNNAGRVAFVAFTADGNSYVVRADPMGGSGGGGQGEAGGGGFAFGSEGRTGSVLQEGPAAETPLRPLWQTPRDQAFPELPTEASTTPQPTVWVRDAQDAYFAILTSRGHGRAALEQGSPFELDLRN
jgi:hypothetical protein